ncbi:uncharacterized protein C8A04DRAFT_30373 [Dichotomopilus funicola]|uniref:Uncharacterized protein n=1 Tax=Dichotomopilus funicola TaxID=1934379 RepID=A0AAN6V054_9PEZI|nr:hypothetical protein C8A04DRAFT_30373 [Dichotomopilus funicola]
MRLLLAAAFAAVLVSAQDTPTPGCTAQSFSIPSWLLDNVAYTDNAVSFDVRNRATNYTASLVCETAEAGVNACSIDGEASSNDPLEASVDTTEDPTVFSLTQSWSCDDREKNLTFTATGTASALLNYTSPLLVRGSLTAPISITPSYPAGPTGHNTPGCTSRSNSPSWTLTTIHYTDEPAVGNSTAAYENFNVLITNPAIAYQASCIPGGGGNGLDDGGVAHLTCAGAEFQSGFMGAYPIGTKAGFDPVEKGFWLEQTWFCDDEDAARPIQLTSSASTTLPLTCTTSPDPTNQTTNTYCVSDPPTITLTAGDDIHPNITTLPPYVLTDSIPIPPSRGDGCTLTSLFEPGWVFSAFQSVTTNTTTGDSEEEKETVSFEMILAAQDIGFQYPIPIYQGEAGDEEGWWACEIGADGGNGLPLWPYECRFKWDGETKGLVVDAKWECKDLDLEHPVRFSGISTSVVNSTLTCETVNGQSTCSTTDPGYSWSAPIEDVTWGAE